MTATDPVHPHVRLGASLFGIAATLPGDMSYEELSLEIRKFQRLVADSDDPGDLGTTVIGSYLLSLYEERDRRFGRSSAPPSFSQQYAEANFKAELEETEAKVSRYNPPGRIFWAPILILLVTTIVLMIVKATT